MMISLLALGFFSSIHCQIKFSGVSSARSPQSPTNPASIVTSKFVFPSNLSTLRPTPRSEEIRFPTYSTAAAPSTDPLSWIPSTQATNARLFALNEDGHVECQERTDCPLGDFVDTENKKVVRYACDISKHRHRRNVTSHHSLSLL